MGGEGAFLWGGRNLCGLICWLWVDVLGGGWGVGVLGECGVFEIWCLGAGRRLWGKKILQMAKNSFILGRMDRKRRDNTYPRLNCILLPTPRCFQAVFSRIGWPFLCGTVIGCYKTLPGTNSPDTWWFGRQINDFPLGFDWFSGIEGGNWGYLHVFTWKMKLLYRKQVLGGTHFQLPWSWEEEYSGWNPALVLWLWWLLGNLIHVNPTILRSFFFLYIWGGSQNFLPSTVINSP